MEKQIRQSAILLVLIPEGELREYHLSDMGKGQLNIGRSSDNDIVLNSSAVSHHHGRLTLQNGKTYYEDLNSSNGTYVDVLGTAKYLHGSQGNIGLKDGMVLNVGGMGNQNAVYMMYSLCSSDEVWKRININKKRLSIGRAPGNDIVLSHPAISRQHAAIEPCQAGGYEIVDVSGKNGTLVNGRMINGRKRLKECDIIQIVAFQMIYLKESIFYKTSSEGISLNIQHLRKVVGGSQKKELLHDVNLQIESNEFVAIIGGSGAGKTTLMNAISGFDRGGVTGKVYCNGLDLYENFKYMKSVIGYVPQEDIIYQNLTLRKMLEYTAKLKMPDDVSKSERDAQIDAVLDMVELKPQQNTYIRKLSGGQKKRASIAVELLADPRLFFLDEPTSGLDPGTEQNLMRTLSRMAATQKKTIIMVTHTIQNLYLCDRIILMGTGGRCCFSGNLEEARMFFDTENLADAYNVVAANSKEWEAQYAKFQKKDYQVKTSGEDSQKSMNPVKRTGKRPSAFRQLMILIQRYLELMKNDWARLLILMIQPVIIGLLLYLVSEETVFDVYENTKTMMFALCCSGIWIGLFNSIQEICKERNILRREYMTNLKLPVYVFSKFAVQSLIGAVQAIFLTGTFLGAIGKNGEGLFLDSFFPELILSIWLVILASEALGLAVSANAKSGDKAMVAAPFILIIQLLFSGILFKLEGFGEWISYVTVSRWTVEALGSTVNLNDLPLKLQADYPMIEHEAEAFFEATKAHVLQDWGILVGMTFLFLIFSMFSLRKLAKDSR